LPSDNDVALVFSYGHYAQVDIRAEALVKLQLPLAIELALSQSGIVQISQIYRLLHLIYIVADNKDKGHLGLPQLYLLWLVGIGSGV